MGREKRDLSHLEQDRPDRKYHSNCCREQKRPLDHGNRGRDHDLRIIKDSTPSSESSGFASASSGSLPLSSIIPKQRLCYPTKLQARIEDWQKRFFALGSFNSRVLLIPTRILTGLPLEFMRRQRTELKSYASLSSFAPNIFVSVKMLHCSISLSPSPVPQPRK